jgi:membrane-associated phospholipid phosphatase
MSLRAEAREWRPRSLPPGRPAGRLSRFVNHFQPWRFQAHAPCGGFLIAEAPPWPLPSPLANQIIAVWCVAFGLALAADRPVATWVHDSGFGERLKTQAHWVTQVGRLPGNFLTFPLIIAAALVVWDRRQWMVALFVLAAGAASGLGSVIKWIVGRARPFKGGMFEVHPFVGGWHGLFGSNQSFPSGDVCLAAATVGSLMILWPRRRGWFVPIIFIVAAERILEGAHYPSDTVAAAALGLALAAGVWRLLCRPRLAEIPKP